MYYDYPWQRFLVLLSGEPDSVLSKEQYAERTAAKIEERREYVLYKLREGTKQDFGYDIQKWRAWLMAHPHCLDPTPEEVAKMHKEDGGRFII